jgi:pantoate kinase
MVKTAKAFAPAAISSFFEIHDTEDNKPITDFERIGARGGGFGLEKGVLTTVTTKEAQKNSAIVKINSKPAEEAKTTINIAQAILSKTDKKYSVVIEHQIEVPVGTGFGTSAGGALTTGLALAQAIGLPLTYNQIGKIAHIAEIQCQTGLGTVSSLTSIGGCPLVIEPGAPGICQIDRIPITSDYMIVAGFVQPSIINKTILSNPQKKKQINQFGKKTLDAILDEPSIDNFMHQCWNFSQNAGFATPTVRQLIKLAEQAGAVGAAQNMIGEAVHALVLNENADQVEEAFKQVLPSEKVLVSKIDFQGARLVNREEI